MPATRTRSRARASTASACRCCRPEPLPRRAAGEFCLARGDEAGAAHYLCVVWLRRCAAGGALVSASPSAGARPVQSAFTLFVLIGLLILAALTGFWAWQEVGSVAIGTHGWIALGLGAVLTFLV